MKRFYAYCFFALFVFLNRSFSQTPSFNFQKLGSEEGLNNANIFSIEQHPNGLLYFTTQNGIYYYDGYTFNKLEIDSLKSNALLNVSFKNDNELCLSLRDEGIASFNLRTKKYELNQKLKFKNSADNFLITDNYAYLLTAQIRLITIDLKTGEQIPDKALGKDNSNRAFCMFKTTDGQILVGRNDGLYKIEGSAQKKLPFPINTAVHSITQNKDGKLVLGTSGKILILNGDKIEKEITPKYKTKNFTFQPTGEKSIDRVLTDNFDRIWFISYPDENLYLFENENVYDVFEVLDIAPTLINCIYKDRDENIWIGTFNDGVYLVENSFFNSLNFLYNNKTLNINQVYLKNNMLVAATSNGLFGLNLNSHITKVLSKPDEIFPEPINTITEVNGGIFYSKRNQIDMSPSIFSDSKFIYRFKPVIAKLFYSINEKQNIIVDWFANVLICNGDCSKITDTLISFPDYRISVNALLKMNDSLFIATNNGLFIYNFKNKTHQNIIRPELNYKINDLALVNGKLYAAHEAGITNVSERKLVQQLGNLRLNSVKKIKQSNDKIWLATLDGVFVCDKDLKPLTILTKASGLPSNSVNDIVFSEENICIATARGIAIANMNQIDNRKSKLNPVIFHSVTVEGKGIDFSQNTISLESDQENVTLQFYSPLFNKPNKQYFRYRIDNGEWNSLLNTSLTYPIVGGKHKLEISASADNIVWSDSTLLTINKEEKLSETNWIYWIITIGGLIIVSLISFLVVKRVKQKATKRLREEQQVNLLKHQAMNALLSPHFIFNSLTSIQNYINTNNSLKASEYLAKFSRLIRMIIEKAAQSEITLHDELTRLTYYLELEKERFKNKFDYVIKVDPALNQTELKIPNMIIQPHVENCIIHGILPKHEHGTLQISFVKKENNLLIITVEDDGIGLIKAKEHAKTGHKSLGTSTIKNILEINSQLSGKRQVVSMVDKSTLNPPTNGTLITIELQQ